MSIPLTELVKVYKYKYHVVKTLKFDPLSDMVNVEDDQLELYLVPQLMVSLKIARSLHFT